MIKFLKFKLIALLLVSFNTYASEQFGLGLPTLNEAQNHTNLDFKKTITEQLQQKGYITIFNINGSYKLGEYEKQELAILPIENYLQALTMKMVLSNNLLLQNGFKPDWGIYPVSLICKDHIYIIEVENKSIAESIVDKTKLEGCKTPPNVF